MRVIQISDTHLSPGKRHFNDNWEPLRSWIEGVGADLVVHTGDLTVDGADCADDLVFGMELMHQVSVPMLIVPGNHDVGHVVGSHQPVNAERLARWRAIVGPDRWFEDFGKWRFVGCNSLLLGHGDSEEAAQFAWLIDALQGANGSRIAIFTHKPLFIDAPEEGDTGYWGVRPTERARLLDLIGQHDVALFASGHLHRARMSSFENTSLVWGPSSAFLTNETEGAIPGDRVVGAVLHEFGDGVTSEIVTIPGLVPHALDDVVHEVYPNLDVAGATQ